MKGKGDLVSDKASLLPLKVGSTNQAAWIFGGGLEVKGNGSIESLSNGISWGNALATSKAMTVEAWIKPKRSCSQGNGMVFSWMKSDGALNFALRKEKERYVWWCSI